MLAEDGNIMHFDLGNRAPDIFIEFQPELPGVRLGLGVGRPVVAYMLVLAGYLAGVASVANPDIYDKYLHYSIPPSTQALKRRPEAWSYSLLKAAS